MKTKRFFSLLMMIVALCCCWTACSSDETDNSTPEDGDESLSFVPTHQDSVSIATQLVYQTLCVADTAICTKLTTGVGDFQPSYGSQLYDVTPTVRYVSANSLADARHIFVSDFLSPITFLNSDTTSTTIRLDLGQQGYVIFQPESIDGHVAKIDINLKQLGSLTEVCFLLQEAWPQNASSDIRQGDTFISRDGHNFICIKDAENHEGMLVTFDIGWDGLLGTDGNLVQRHDPTLGEWPNDPSNLPSKYPWHSYIFYSHDGMANVNQLYYLQGFLYEEGKQNMSSMEALKRIATDRVVDLLYGVGEVFLCSDGCWFYTGTNYKYEDVLYYSMKKKGVKRDDIIRDYIWFSMRFFVMYPNLNDCCVEDWQANSFDIRENYIYQYKFTDSFSIQRYGSFKHNEEYSWNYKCGYEMDNFIRVRCFEFGHGFDYEAAGLTKTDSFDRKTNF